MSPTLLKRLVFPLLVLFSLAIVVHVYWIKADGFFLNLATELIGILITICYVDWILREHEQQRWLSTDSRIANRLQILLNATISGLRRGLGFGTDVLNEQTIYSLDEYAMHKDVMRVGEHIIKPSAQSRVKALDKIGWVKLAEQIQNSHNGVQSFLNAFQNRLTPNQISDLLYLQDALAKSLTSYTTFPDIMGVPENELPKTKTPPEMLQQFGCESTSKELQNICDIAKKLSESIERKNA